MTTVMQSSTAHSIAFDASSAPEGWSELRENPNIQFEEVVIPPQPPREPNWFERMMAEVVEFLANLFAPIGQALGVSWPVLQWVWWITVKSSMEPKYGSGIN